MSKRWIQLDEALLDAARAAMAGASPRPWRARLTMMGDHWIAADGCGAGSSWIVVGADAGLDEYDAPAIVAAVTLADAAIAAPAAAAGAEVATLRAERDEARRERDEARAELTAAIDAIRDAADDVCGMMPVVTPMEALHATTGAYHAQRIAHSAQLAKVRAAGEGMAEDVRRYVGSVYAWARTASDAGETAEESLRSVPTIEAIRDALARWDALAEAGEKGEGR